MSNVLERVAAGGLVVIDGGTGTEIQRRGGAMDDATWCAETNLQRPGLVFVCMEDKPRGELVVVTLWEEGEDAEVPKRFTDVLRGRR